MWLTEVLRWERQVSESLLHIQQHHQLPPAHQDAQLRTSEPSPPALHHRRMSALVIFVLLQLLQRNSDASGSSERDHKQQRRVLSPEALNYHITIRSGHSPIG
ncbi:hypothetical protein ABVT39_009968 [Epinephelus coioides]